MAETKIVSFTYDGKPVKVSVAVHDAAGHVIDSYYASKEELGALTEGVAKLFTYDVVTELPEAGEKGHVYLVAHAHSDGSLDAYDEYLWTGTAFEKLGNTDVDLSGVDTTYALTQDKADGHKITLTPTRGGKEGTPTELTIPDADTTYALTYSPEHYEEGAGGEQTLVAPKLTLTPSSGDGTEIELPTAYRHPTYDGCDLGYYKIQVDALGHIAKAEEYADAEKDALASGVTAAKVAAYDAYASGKQDRLTEAQQAAVDSGVTADTVAAVSANAQAIADISGSVGKLFFTEETIDLE